MLQRALSSRPAVCSAAAALFNVTLSSRSSKHNPPPPSLSVEPFQEIARGPQHRHRRSSAVPPLPPTIAPLLDATDPPSWSAPVTLFHRFRHYSMSIITVLPPSAATAVTVPLRFQPARSSPRSIIAHIGPTNSGNAMRWQTALLREWSNVICFRKDSWGAAVPGAEPQWRVRIVWQWRVRITVACAYRVASSGGVCVSCGKQRRHLHHYYYQHQHQHERYH